MPRPLGELYLRRKVCQNILKTLDEMKDDPEFRDDPRLPDAIEHYKAMLGRRDAEIAEVTGKPPPVVVELKTAKLFAESELE